MITYHVELLFEYRCGECGKTWSIRGVKPGGVMRCPHCGEEQPLLHEQDLRKVFAAVMGEPH